MGDFLFGQAPSVDQEPSTLDVTKPQNTLLQNLVNMFTNSTTQAQSQIGTLGASPTLQTAGLTQDQQGTIAAQTGTVNSAENAVTGGLTSALSTDQTVAGSTPADFSSYFQNSVVQPLLNSFNTQTIPALQNAFGQSAGGTHSSTYAQGVDTATNNLENTIASDASSTSLAQYDQQQQNDLTAASQEGTLANTGSSALTSALAGQTAAQTTQQTAYSNAYQEFLNQLTQNNTELSNASSLATANTVQQGNTVVNPGNAGLINTLVSSVGSAVGSKI